MITADQYSYNSCVLKTMSLCTKLQELNPKLYGCVWPVSPESSMFYIPINDKYQLTVCIIQVDKDINIDNLYYADTFLQQPGINLEKLSESIKISNPTETKINNTYLYWKNLLTSNNNYI